MNKIEQLIEELCPQGVEFKALGEVCEFINGKGHEKKIDENGKYIVVNSKFVSTEGKVKKYSVDQISPIFKDDVLMVMSDLPNGKALAKCFHVDHNDKYTLNQRICALTAKDNDNLNAKYLFYILNRNRQLLRYDNGVDQTNLRKNDILKIKIPIPPLTIQKEIVKIFDNFTQLEAELEAELEARKKQYEHYREELLNFGDDVEFKALGEVCGYSESRVDADRLNAKTFIGVDNLLPNKAGKNDASYTPNTKRLTLYRIGDVLLGNIRPYLKKIWLADNEGGCSGDVLAIRISEDNHTCLLPEFIYYLLSSDIFFAYDMQHAKGAKMPRGSKEAILNYQIPIPPLSKQKEIIAILDKFDTLVNDISAGLPAEISARKKQYEYYRNQLLTFKPLELQDAN